MLATGSPVIDAHEDFARARRAALAARAAWWLGRDRRRPDTPRTPADVGLPWGTPQLRVIPLAEIVGTVEPTSAFDARFRPATNLVRDRWERTALAHRRGLALPPVELEQRAGGYYVVDGRHRVSVARALGDREIAAWVTSVRGTLPADTTTTPRRRLAVSHRTGFWTVALSFAVVMALGAVPTPLYVLYERRDHFSGLVVTVIFAVYAVGVITSLLLAGHVSDWLGRRRVLVPAVALQGAAAAIFAIWPALPGLLVGRVLSGLAVGAITATATAYLAELHQARCGQAAGRRAELVATAANLGGIGFGALAAGLLAQFLPAPLVLSYVALGVAALLLALAASLVPETAPIPERPRYRVQRVSVPAAGRRRFVAAAVGAAVAFALFGLFTSLAPNFLAATLGHGSHALAGATAFVVFAAGALAQFLLARRETRTQAAIGVALLPAGLAQVTVATWAPDLPAFLVGGLLSGAGAGLLVKSGIDTVLELAAPEARAERLATYFLAGYLGLSVPIVGLGVAS